MGPRRDVDVGLDAVDMTWGSAGTCDREAWSRESPRATDARFGLGVGAVVQSKDEES